MTQERLAELVDIPEVDGNTIAQLEGGRKKYLPEQPLLGSICRALGVSEIAMLQESGVITEAIPESGATRDPFPSTDIRSQIVDLLKSPRISEQTLLGIRQMLEGMVGSDR
jgi:transcriptional regulator with XRE-family HTH domain